MDERQTWAHIDDQRADLADFLDTLTPEQWDAPSLCPGWTVRQVAAHVTQSTTNWGRLTVELLRSGLRFNELMLRMAREDQRRPEQITAAMRSMVGGRRKPPGTAPVDPLMDTLLHGQDIAVPLGIERTMPIEPAATVAERLWKMGFPFNARKRFPNTEFIATDADFRVGSGEVVRGPIQDIVMALSGRPAALPVE